MLYYNIKRIFYLTTISLFLFSVNNVECSTVNVNNPQVFMNQDGNMTTITINYENGIYTVQAISKSLSGSWGTPLNISTPSQYISDCQAQMDNNGNMVVAWITVDAATQLNCINANSYSVQTGWAKSATISGSGQQFGGVYSICINSGNIEIVWSAVSDNMVLLYSSGSVAGQSKWSSPVVLPQKNVNLEEVIF